MAEESSAAEHGTSAATSRQPSTQSSEAELGAHPTTPADTAPLDELFDREELAQFDRDDVAAGSHIGKMLALFFLYTVIVMSIVAYWTYSVVSE